MGFLGRTVYYKDLADVLGKSLTCGYCGHLVHPNKGFPIVTVPRYTGVKEEERGGVYICPSCDGAIFCPPSGDQYPSAPFGNALKHLPSSINAAYQEARRCTQEKCFTAAALMCRKILMHVAVDKGAKPGKTFVEYVDHLKDKGHVTAASSDWVDHIREKGNEATHELPDISEEDANDLLDFTEMLLKTVYEFPARHASKGTP